MNTSTHYPTDLTDSQWALLKPLLPPIKSGTSKGGRPASDRRQVINGLLYLNRTSCQWRMIPPSFGEWRTIYGYFKRWSEDATWKNIMDTLRKEVRKQEGHDEEPSACSVDSQTVKASIQSEDKGYDGGKKINGRKRHILVDTLGLIITVVVTAANYGEREGLKDLLSGYMKNGFNRLRKIWVDNGYFGEPLDTWVKNIKQTHKIVLEVGESKHGQFEVEKKRWVVERTFSWLFNNRRHSKDYERLTRNSESMINISMIHLLLKRLA
jgi:putative transposase